VTLGIFLHELLSVDGLQPGCQGRRAGDLQLQRKKENKRTIVAETPKDGASTAAAS
jgi:hypothetical protein